MMVGIAITRLELSSSELRAASAKAPDARSARRILALALVLEGAGRETAATCGMSRQTLCDWVHRYNDEGLAGLTNRLSAGPPRRLSEAKLAELAALVEKGPDPAVDGVVRWRCADLKRVIAERFGVAMHERTVGKQLAALGLVRLSVRPQHPKADDAAQEAFKKTSLRPLMPLSPKRAATSRSKSGSRTRPASVSKAR